MKMKEFGPQGGGARPWRPPLDPPMFTILIFSILMGIGLYRSRDDRQEMGGNNNNNMEFRVTAMLLTEATVFMIVRLPLVVLVPLHQVHGPSHPVIGDALRFCAFLIPLNHSTSFFIYVGLLPEESIGPLWRRRI